MEGKRQRPKIQAYAKTTNGVSNPVVAVILLAILILASSIVIFLIVLHNQDSTAAYRFSGMRRERDRYKAICDENYAMLARRAEWDRRNNIQPPIEYTVPAQCLVPDEQKVLEQQEEHKQE